MRIWLALLLLLSPLVVQAQQVRILFLGNSHTANNNVPLLVKNLIQSDGSGRKVTYTVITGAFLEDLAKTKRVVDTIRTGKWNYVVLQGAKLSSSHNFNYSQDGAIALARLALQSGAKPMLFAEWPRKGWNETDYILGVYAKIKAASGAFIIPVCRGWDLALSQVPTLNLWATDGNHSSLLGAYLASGVIYYWLSGDSRTPKFTPSGLSSAQTTQMIQFAKQTYGKYGK